MDDKSYRLSDDDKRFHSELMERGCALATAANVHPIVFAFGVGRLLALVLASAGLSEEMTEELLRSVVADIRLHLPECRAELAAQGMEVGHA